MYFLLVIPPLFYLNIGMFPNVGTYFSILGVCLAGLYRSAFHFGIDKKKIILILNITFFIFYLGFNNSLINSQKIGFIAGSFWWIFLLFVILFFRVPSFDRLMKISHGVSIVSILVLSLDAVYRLIFNVVQRDDIGRYAFKRGLIDIDSNFAGIYALLIFFMSFYCIRYSRKFIKYLPVLYVLILATLSIAAIAVTSIFMVFFLTPKKLKIFLMFFLFLSLPVLFNYLLDIMANSPSGLTKIQFMQEAVHLFINRDVFDVLFGTGVSSVKLNGFDPHLLILQLILEFGMIGFTLYFSIQVALISLFSKAYVYIFLPFFMVSFSVASISNPIFSVVILIFYYFSYYENGQREMSN